jgi:4-aminobutyrate aminotransferase
LFAALDGLRKEPEVSPHILDVRGAGLMVGVELTSPSTSANDPFTAPNGPPNLAARVAKRCQEKGLFILTTSVYQVCLHNHQCSRDLLTCDKGNPIHPPA